MCFFFLLNSNIFFFNNINTIQNGTLVFVCLNQDWLTIWEYVNIWHFLIMKLHFVLLNNNNSHIKVHLGLYSLVPFTVLTIFNILMLMHIYKKSRRLKVTTDAKNSSVPARTRTKSPNKTVVATTILFILLTLPTAIVSILYNNLFTTDYGKFIVNFADDLSFTYHGMNLLILAVFNRKFRTTLVEMF